MAPGSIPSDWGLVTHAGHFSIQWDGTAPAGGTKYRFAVFPRTASDRNPLHWSGHPMDLVANVLDYIGTPYNLASLQAIGEALGLDLKIHLRITQGETAQTFLENTVYGTFGVASRLNEAGELEFVLTRDPSTARAGPLCWTIWPASRAPVDAGGSQRREPGDPGDPVASSPTPGGPDSGTGSTRSGPPRSP
jgi:hypothetical protein